MITMQRGTGLANTDGQWRQKYEAAGEQTREELSSMHMLSRIKVGLWDSTSDQVLVTGIVKERV